MIGENRIIWTINIGKEMRDSYAKSFFKMTICIFSNFKLDITLGKKIL